MYIIKVVSLHLPFKLFFSKTNSIQSCENLVVSENIDKIVLILVNIQEKDLKKYFPLHAHWQ